jgi:ribosomal protein S18 acetylase RimI-like enzyme
MEIIDYTNDYREVFKNLNLEWLEKYFEVEPIDHALLSDPEKNIIDNGGFIFLARYDNTIVGTVALLKINEVTFELSKMAVTEKLQGLGIGKALLAHCIHTLKSLNKEKLILYSNTILTAAIELYKKFGFIEVELDNSEYKRSNIKMELELVDG